MRTRTSGLLAAAAFLLAGLLTATAVEVELLRRRVRPDLPPPPGMTGPFGRAGDRPLLFAVAGDSTAAGVGAGTIDLAYPSLLAAGLAATGRRVELLNLGVSGARVRDVLRDQVPAIERARPGLVLFAASANDVMRATPLPRLRREVDETLARLKATGAVVVMAGGPYMHGPVFRLQPLRTLITWRSYAVNRVLRSAGAAAGVPVVPVAELTWLGFTGDPDRNYSEDRFHPSADGYAMWARVLLPALTGALGRSADATA
jgi:lysophospholipase L1-like esterase